MTPTNAPADDALHGITTRAVMMTGPNGPRSIPAGTEVTVSYVTRNGWAVIRQPGTLLYQRVQLATTIDPNA